jgi:hypothetical protein
MEELVRLGISWIWVGLESPQSSYAKLKDADTRAIVGELRSHGIKLLGSTIVGLEHHTPENIQDDIDYAASHGTDFHQFMLYTPVPGTPLYRQMSEQGRMLDDVELVDIHGQFKFNFQHAAISREESKQFLDGAFRQDFEENGPSLFRFCRTLFNGWRRYQDHPEARVRARFAHQAHKLGTTYNAALWAMEQRLKQSNPQVAARICRLRREIENAFGLPTRLLRMTLGPILVWTSQREDRRMANGVTYEPETFVKRHNRLEGSARGGSSKRSMMIQRGFKPSLENIAASVRLAEEPALTVIGE